MTSKLFVHSTNLINMATLKLVNEDVSREKKYPEKQKEIKDQSNIWNEKATRFRKSTLHSFKKAKRQ